MSPVKQSPNATESASEKSMQGSVRVPTEDSRKTNVSSIPVGGETVETPRVYVGSPFRLIQGYASDDSEEDDKKEDVEIHADGSSPMAAAASGLHADNRSNLPSSFRPDDVSSVEISRELQTDSCQLSPLTLPKEGGFLVSLPDKATSQSVACHSSIDPLNKVVDLQDDDKWTDKIMKHDLSQNNDFLDANHQVEKHHLEEGRTLDSAKLDVDEFGRLVRKGASDSEPDEVHLSGRHAKRGRSRSRSRSPQESRWRHRSRSPRRREKRSRSCRYELISYIF